VKLIEKAAGDEAALKRLDDEAGDIVAVRQGNVFGTSFHPELSGDARLHVWWVGEVLKALGGRREGDGEGDGE
jgi:5'-phosphate synthase pdxT subunit